MLRAVDYGETSQIVTFLTRTHGKVAALAKGSRNVKSRFGSTLQPMAYVDLVYYSRSTRSVQTLTEATHVRRLENLRRDLQKITIGLRCVELANAMVIEGEIQPGIFDLLAESLGAIDAEHARPANVLPFFQLSLANELGFAPSFDRESVQDLPQARGTLNLTDGSIGPVSAGRDSRTASRSALRAFAVFARADLGTTLRMELKDEVSREVQDLIESYFRYHVEAHYPVRAASVATQLLDGRRTGL